MSKDTPNANIGDSMDQKSNILFAKKHIVENIYSSVKIEGLALTFPETAQIIENKDIKNYYNDEVDFVNDLKHTWQYIFTNINNTVDIQLLKNINRLAGKFTVINAGKIRYIWDEPIFVRGEHGEVVYTPPVPPKESVIDKELKDRYSIEDKTDAALELYLYIAKAQLFNDGNKRTASLICNMVLIQNGCGIFIVPNDLDLEFKRKLVSYYVNDDAESFKAFLKENCVFLPKEYSIGQKIQLLREKDNMSRAEFSDQFGITEDMLVMIEKDKVRPSQDIINKIAEHYEIDQSRLVESPDSPDSTVFSLESSTGRK